MTAWSSSSRNSSSVFATSASCPAWSFPASRRTCSALARASAFIAALTASGYRGLTATRSAIPPSAAAVSFPHVVRVFAQHLGTGEAGGLRRPPLALSRCRKAGTRRPPAKFSWLRGVFRAPAPKVSARPHHAEALGAGFGEVDRPVGGLRRLRDREEHLPVACVQFPIHA